MANHVVRDRKNHIDQVSTYTGGHERVNGRRRAGLVVPSSAAETDAAGPQ